MHLSFLTPVSTVREKQGDFGLFTNKTAPTTGAFDVRSYTCTHLIHDNPVLDF